VGQKASAGQIGRQRWLHQVVAVVEHDKVPCTAPSHSHPGLLADREADKTADNRAVEAGDATGESGFPSQNKSRDHQTAAAHRWRTSLCRRSSKQRDQRQWGGWARQMKSPIGIAEYLKRLTTTFRWGLPEAGNWRTPLVCWRGVCSVAGTRSGIWFGRRLSRLQASIADPCGRGTWKRQIGKGAGLRCNWALSGLRLGRPCGRARVGPVRR